MKAPLRNISSHYAWTPQGWLRRPILSFDSEGRLVSMREGAPEGSASDRGVDSSERVEFFSGILIPGMVNAHCHLELSYLRGKIAPGGGFAKFSSEIARVREQADEQECIEAARYWDARMWSEGVSAVADISNSTFTLPLKAQSPIHYHTFVEYFGLSGAGFRAMDKVVEKAQKLALDHSKTPHSTYSLPDSPFRELTCESERLSIHFMESSAEAELFEGAGSLHERFEALGLPVDFRHYGSPAQRLIASTPRDKQLLLIHNTLVDELTIKQITEHFTTPTTWVLCPRSNDYIERLTPPVALLRRAGVRLALGTDSLASNESLSLIEELKLIPEVPLHERIDWVTRLGAEALGLADRLGSFEVGRSSGAVLIEGVEWADDPAQWQLSPTSSTKRLLP